jgi:nitrate reductase delta subunit
LHCPKEILSLQCRVAEAIENSPKEPETLDELDELWKEQEAFSGESSECNTCEDDASLN